MVDIKTESVSMELQERIESNKQELDQYLGVYPYDRFLVWLVLLLAICTFRNCFHMYLSVV